MVYFVVFRLTFERYVIATWYKRHMMPFEIIIYNNEVNFRFTLPIYGLTPIVAKMYETRPDCQLSVLRLQEGGPVYKILNTTKATNVNSWSKREYGGMFWWHGSRDCGTSVTVRHHCESLSKMFWRKWEKKRLNTGLFDNFSSHVHRHRLIVLEWTRIFEPHS